MLPRNQPDRIRILTAAAATGRHPANRTSPRTRASPPSTLGLRVPLAVSSPRYLALTNIRRRSQSLPAATEDKHRPPSTPNRARTIWTPIPYWMDGAADVAETTCTPFQSEPDAAPVRLIVPCPYRPFRCCIVIPSVDLGLGANP